MRLSELQRQLTALIQLIEYGCGHEYCMMKPGPSWREDWPSSPDRFPRPCQCTPPDIQLRLRTLARSIKGYQWEQEE